MKEKRCLENDERKAEVRRRKMQVKFEKVNKAEEIERQRAVEFKAYQKKTVQEIKKG